MATSLVVYLVVSREAAHVKMAVKMAVKMVRNQRN